MTNSIRITGRLVLAVVVVSSIISLAGCGKGDGKEAEAPPPALLVSREDVFVVSNTALSVLAR